MDEKKTSTTVVACYTLEGHLVKIYPSASKAAKSRRLFHRTIDRCIRGEIPTVKGLQWKRFEVDHVPTSISPLEDKPLPISIRPVAKLDDKGDIIEVYPSINKASKMNDIDPRTLRDRLNNKYKYDGRAKYRYLSIEEIEQYGFSKGQEIDNKKKPVIQYSLDGKYIKTYPSIQKALQAMNKSPRNQGIHQCLKGQYKTAFGYVWRYKKAK